MWMWSTGINRNIVECKGVRLLMFLFSCVVLIETLWNVKKIRKPLILLHGNRINRNIVECKVSYATPQQIGASAVLIETLWNVKEKRERKVENAGYCINRNIVECKE